MFIIAGHKGMAVYTRELKIKARKMYFEEAKKTVKICKELEIRNRSQPLVWFNEYSNGNGYDSWDKKQGHKKAS